MNAGVIDEDAEQVAAGDADDCAEEAKQRGFNDEQSHDPGARRAHGEHGADFAGALEHCHQQRIHAGHEHHEEDDDAEENEDGAEERADLFVISSELDPFLEDQVLGLAVELRKHLGGDEVSVIGVIEADNEVGNSIALQQALRGGKRDAEIAVVHLLEPGVNDPDDLHIDAVERAVRGDSEQGEAVAWLDAHGARNAGADEGLDLAA